MKYLPEILHLVGSPERKKALGRRYYQNNKAKLVENQRTYRLANPEYVKQKSLNHYASFDGRAKRLLSGAITRAAKRGWQCDLDLEWVKLKLTRGVCEISGIPFVLMPRGRQRRSPYGPSIDRRDNSKGYTKENCRIILWALNMGFADWGQEVYLDIAKVLVGFDL